MSHPSNVKSGKSSTGRGRYQATVQGKSQTDPQKHHSNVGPTERGSRGSAGKTKGASPYACSFYGNHGGGKG